ncbi:FAD-dependent oxidoreductase [Micromonospora inositola]|uniref:ferredoxin--NADP(+) reductase n=1 Tax=Micromonospora inositola TaxID=47865 RepID=A0A1C5K546_9ACTN|nr:FAD-dependent oxidoreductase [Micromonospora inositola]SCG77908.1 ferredoxin--NADP+ reductase [Micromonospora inositola]
MTAHLGTGAPPPRVAVVGAGPSGLYAAQALVEQDRLPVLVDVLDRLPTPYGLIRYGVAPDHVRMKAVANTLRRTLEDPRVRFLGDVEVGRDVSAEELRAHYDAVVYCTGAAAERTLGIPGEDLPGSMSAGELVSWYSGHPDAVALDALRARTAVVVGAGNVALDVARMLLQSPEVLRPTDVPLDVLRVFEASAVRDVHILVRRGPEHVRFTPKELRDLGRVEDVDWFVDPSDLDRLRGAAHPSLSTAAVLCELAAREPTGASRRAFLHFWTSPVELSGTGKVDAVTVARTRPGAPAGGDGRPDLLPAGLVVRCVGYVAAPPVGLPFDPLRACVPNDAGRVIGPAVGIRPGEYVAGWLKRGPSGVIGTNKPDAEETVESVLDDLSRRAAASPTRRLDDLLRERGVNAVTYAGWLAIDGAEAVEGRPDGRGRVKIPDWRRLRENAASTTAAAR